MGQNHTFQNALMSDLAVYTRDGPPGLGSPDQ